MIFVSPPPCKFCTRKDLGLTMSFKQKIYYRETIELFSHKMVGNESSKEINKEHEFTH